MILKTTQRRKLMLPPLRKLQMKLIQWPRRRLGRNLLFLLLRKLKKLPRKKLWKDLPSTLKNKRIFVLTILVVIFHRFIRVLFIDFHTFIILLRIFSLHVILIKVSYSVIVKLKKKLARKKQIKLMLLPKLMEKIKLMLLLR